LEHFRYDIAVDLMLEFLRVLQPGGVVRTVVPDSDYRTYEAPEPAGYPGRGLLFSHPNKHKVRWNVYLLGRTLEMSGFKPRPVVWCDEDGEFHQKLPTADATPVEPDLVTTLRYVQRPHSLIVDGIKP
jgi:predicted SAM-dependent methyltransferase